MVPEEWPRSPRQSSRKHPLLGLAEAKQLLLVHSRSSSQGAESRLTALRAVLKHKRLDPLPPYKPEAWHEFLLAAGLLDKYPSIPDGLRLGFDAGIPPISWTFAPLNHPSIAKHIIKFNTIIQTEFQRERYVGPVTQEEVELLIGPFQTSPLSIIPKPGRPGKF